VLPATRKTALAFVENSAERRVATMEETPNGIALDVLG
jgi:hypothetical protein